MIYFVIGFLIGLIFAGAFFLVLLGGTDGTLVISENPWQLNFSEGEEKLSKKKILKIRVVFKK